ncbi:ATP-binding protein [Rhodococcus rhodochrous]|uniref:ATP-binding protein n=1 Tax=Rhodococcus rhodochrous TaxID=1829 RepID=UPI000B09EA5F|nr:ATP-binding protein [Rhodococcus rhodochrous]
MTTHTRASERDLTAELSFLTRALKAPTLREAARRLIERARAENWTHEEFLVACLQREVSARESHGGESRIRSARFPARKSLEEFDFDHARGLKQETIAHLGTLDFVTAKDAAEVSRRGTEGVDKRRRIGGQIAQTVRRRLTTRPRGPNIAATASGTAPPVPAAGWPRRLRAPG